MKEWVRCAGTTLDDECWRRWEERRGGRENRLRGVVASCHSRGDAPERVENLESADVDQRCVAAGSDKCRLSYRIEEGEFLRVWHVGVEAEANVLELWKLKMRWMKLNRDLQGRASSN